MQTRTKFYQFSPVVYFGFLIGFALLVRLAVGMFYHNTFDLEPYNIPWALGLRDGVFDIYSRLDNLDYPPLFPFLLTLVADGVSSARQADIWQLQMFWIKLIPILFDVALVAALYLIGLRQSQLCAFLLGGAWALNVSAIYNCSFWGQTDSMLMLFLLLCMVALHQRKPLLACILFALGCLSKLQMAYFAPILLCELFFYEKPRNILKSLGAGIGVGLLGWLPFMIGGKNWTLPFQIYFGGFGKYKYINVNAANVYGLAEKNWVTEDASLFGGKFDWESGQTIGGFTYAHLSTVLTVVLFLCLLAGYVIAYRRGTRVPAAAHALFFMNGIFMLTTKMHERYQMPVLILSLVCFIVCEDRRWFYGFLGLTVTTFLNQAIVLAQANFGGIFKENFSIFQLWISLANILLFLFLGYLYFQCIFRKNPRLLKAETEDAALAAA